MDKIKNQETTVTAKHYYDGSDSEGWWVGPVDEDSSQEIVQKAANQALRKYNDESNEEHYRFIVEILGSKVFFCCGSSHYIKMVLGKSTTGKKDTSADEFEQKNCVECDIAERKTIVARCESCHDDEDGKIGSKPCDYVTLSEDTWGEFDGFTHMGLK